LPESHRHRIRWLATRGLGSRDCDSTRYVQ
jgi:hypothetical protein